MMASSKMHAPEDVPQSSKMSAEQVMNRAGGFVYEVDDMQRLRRFLILGSEGNTYYIGEKQLTIENVRALARLIQSGKGTEAVDEIVKYSVEGRTAKQDALLLTFAFCAHQKFCVQTKKRAYEKLADVIRIPTHLFSFIADGEKVSVGTGWGRAQRRAICEWYTQFKDNPKRLAVHVTKYKNRNGWSHKDVLRLAHPKTDSPAVGATLCYVVKGLATAKERYEAEENEDVHKVLKFLQAVEDIKAVKDIQVLLNMIRQHQLVREHIPTQHLNSPEVWKVLLENMPLTAMIRNLGKMTSIGLFEEDNPQLKIVLNKLGGEEGLKQARIHPFNVLVALKIYGKGAGDKGSLKWTPNPDIVKALDAAFYLSFKFVEPTNKRYLLAVDVSGSMCWGGCMGCTAVTPYEAAAAMCMVAVKKEPSFETVAFAHTLSPVNITAEMDLTTVMNEFSRFPMGGTDCATPMVYAKQNNKMIDVFVVYTDCETLAGPVHPDEALRQYRRHSGIFDAKLIVCAMTSDGFTLADPNDPGMLDVVGFDSGVPEVMRNFSLGKL